MYYNTKYRDKNKNYIYDVLFDLRGINMKEMKESIAFMQKNLNQLLEANGSKSCQSPMIYSLSVMLDKEIVRYYKNLTNTRCS